MATGENCETKQAPKVPLSTKVHDASGMDFSAMAVLIQSSYFHLGFNSLVDKEIIADTFSFSHSVQSPVLG